MDDGSLASVRLGDFPVCGFHSQSIIFSPLFSEAPTVVDLLRSPEAEDGWNPTASA